MDGPRTCSPLFLYLTPHRFRYITLHTGSNIGLRGGGWCPNNTQLPHHSQVISHCPMFDGKPVPETHEMHLRLLKRMTGSIYALEGIKMSTTHAHTTGDGVTFGHQLLD